MKDELLIIFYKNPELGKVKTRLAATLGDEKALAFYIQMATHTREVASEIQCDRWLFYSHHVDTEDAWDNRLVQKKLQQGQDLGERMKNAFMLAFEQGYRRISIIGTDCLELDTSILNSAFAMLRSYDVVIGPARDGGYYLLGMNDRYFSLFDGKRWGSDSVLADTLRDTKALNLKVSTSVELSDVDEAKDLPPGWI